MTEPGDGTAASSPAGEPRQRIFGSGFAYAALGADVHVFQDRGPVYALTAYTAPVEEDVRRLRDQPSRLLDARFHTVPFTGRDRELAGLARWRDRPDASAAVRWLHAPGGQGKTRLADEFSRRSAQAGWTVVHAVGHDAVHRSSGRHRDLRVPEDAPGVLVIVDYADRWPLSHLTWLFSNALLRQPVLTRVLLLARTTDGWPPLRAALSRTRAATDERRLEPLPSGPGSRRRMFTVARDAFATAYGVTDPARLTPPGSLDHPDFGLTLAVHMAALVAVDTAVHGGRPPGDMVGLSAHLLDRESRRSPPKEVGRPG
ncbi:hypothetical protein [Streptomyces sp. NPDC088812]|uniref:hypothetical protein n=1 Tax=Streptomyces sp. NPDC088812 TaxID=3365905 RepID=UPI003819E0E4